jgi:hypothetical protein
LVGGVFGLSERGARFFRTQTPHRDSRKHQAVESPRRGREKARVEVRKHTLRLVDVPDQKESPNFKVARECGVPTVAVRLEGRPRSVKHFRRPTKIARGESDFSLSDYAPRAGYGLLRTEGARGLPQEVLGSYEIAKLRHRDATKRESSCVVTQRDSLQGAQGITGRERTG